MADGTIYVPVAGTGTAPQTYTVPGATSIDLQAVRADFDGSGAATFKPAVQILDSSGHVMAQVVGDTVAAGGSASATFAPFLRSNQQASSGGTRVFFCRAQDAGGFALSGVPKTVHIASFFSNDGAAEAIGIQGGGVDQIVLESQAFMYTVTVIADWDVFAGNRTLTLETTDGQTGWFAPLTTTTTSAVQTLSGLVQLDATAPTQLKMTMAQATGVSRSWNYVAVLVQAVELTV